MAEQLDDGSYYALLGVAPTASDEEIRRAFRQLATTLHPDKASMCLCTQAMACCNARRVSLLSDCWPACMFTFVAAAAPRCQAGCQCCTA